MKKNRINPIEQHFEKAVLGGVSVVLLGVVAMQFLTQPNAVKSGDSPNPVAPGQIYEPIKAKAEELLAQMRSVSPDLPEVPRQDVATQFAQVSSLDAANAVVTDKFGVKAEVQVASIGNDNSGDAATAYALPAIPAPASLAAASHRGTLNPLVVAANPEIAKLVSSTQPFDIAAVSIEGHVNGSSLRSSLEADPDGDGPMRPLPLSWWRGNVELLGIEAERQELDAAGAWGGNTIIAGLPGEPSLLTEARKPGIAPADVLQIAQQAQGFIRDIAEPEFPQTIAGPDWVKPSEQQEDSGLSDDQTKINRLKKQVATMDRKIAALTTQRDAVGSGGGDPGREQSGGGGGGRLGGGRGQSPPTNTPSTDPIQKKRDAYQAQIDAADRERQRIVADLAKLGVDVDGAQTQNQGQAEPVKPLPYILDAEDMPVWVHDLTAQQGKTYRYRIRVVLNNPLFGRGIYLAESQQDAAKSPTMEGPWSEWTDPVDLESDRHYFVTTASADDALGGGPRASVEVYQFYYGYWRKGSTTLEPGDLIHARAKLPDNLLAWDIDQLKQTGFPGSGPGRTGQPAQPGFQPGRLPPPESDRERRMGLDPEFQGQPRPQAGDTPTELPPGAKPLPKSMDLDVPAMLIDVASVPGSQGGFEAVLRRADGSLVFRDAGADRSGDLYKRLASSPARARIRANQNPIRPRIGPYFPRRSSDEPVITRAAAAAVEAVAAEESRKESSKQAPLGLTNGRLDLVSPRL
ncbi:MAG: hypothetical protein IPJ41_03960 [Phycisphaerales bacterium]|nr:hypothetical protein [Phycisphaerales bacterium]